MFQWYSDLLSLFTGRSMTAVRSELYDNLIRNDRFIQMEDITALPADERLDFVITLFRAAVRQKKWCIAYSLLVIDPAVTLLFGQIIPTQTISRPPHLIYKKSYAPLNELVISDPWHMDLLSILSVADLLNLLREVIHTAITESWNALPYQYILGALFFYIEQIVIAKERLELNLPLQVDIPIDHIQSCSTILAYCYTLLDRIGEAAVLFQNSFLCSLKMAKAGMQADDLDYTCQNELLFFQGLKYFLHEQSPTDPQFIPTPFARNGGATNIPFPTLQYLAGKKVEQYGLCNQGTVAPAFLKYQNDGYAKNRLNMSGSRVSNMLRRFSLS